MTKISTDITLSPNDLTRTKEAKTSEDRTGF